MPIRMPLSSRCPILRAPATGCGVAPQLTRNRRRTTTQAAGDLTHPNTLRTENGDLFPLGKRQITSRHRTQRDRRHPTSLAEPSRPNRRRHPSPGSSVLARNTTSDRLPKPDPILTPRSRRPTRRPQPTPQNPRLEDPRRGPQRTPTLPQTRQCCNDPLNPGLLRWSLWRFWQQQSRRLRPSGPAGSPTSVLEACTNLPSRP